MTNTLDFASLGEKDFRRTLPRYQQEHADNNRQLAAGFAGFAAAKGCTPAQLALAWVLAQGKYIIPIPGTKRRQYLLENAGAVDIQLNAADFTAIEALLKKFPDVGDRYNEANKKYVDIT
jgi:aryl-alcohol dehydrogenase-like predicted oxidoreductase